MFNFFKRTSVSNITTVMDDPISVGAEQIDAGNLDDQIRIAESMLITAKLNHSQAVANNKAADALHYSSQRKKLEQLRLQLLQKKTAVEMAAASREVDAAEAELRSLSLEFDQVERERDDLRTRLLAEIPEMLRGEASAVSQACLESREAREELRLAKNNYDSQELIIYADELRTVTDKIRQSELQIGEIETALTMASLQEAATGRSDNEQHLLVRRKTVLQKALPSLNQQRDHLQASISQHLITIADAACREIELRRQEAEHAYNVRNKQLQDEVSAKLLVFQDRLIKLCERKSHARAEINLKRQALEAIRVAA